MELERQNFDSYPSAVHSRRLLRETGQQSILQLRPRVRVDLLPESTVSR